MDEVTGSGNALARMSVGGYSVMADPRRICRSRRGHAREILLQKEARVTGGVARLRKGYDHGWEGRGAEVVKNKKA